MAKVKIRGVDAARRRALRIVVGSIASSPELKKIDEFAKSEFRKGKLLDGSSIKSLAPSTIEFRQRYARVNRTGKGYSPRKSNLTFTGQFLESLKTSVELVRDKIRVRISPTGIHRGLRKINGGRFPGVSNAELGRFLIEGGRDWRRVGPATTRKFKSILLKIIRRSTKRV